MKPESHSILGDLAKVIDCEHKTAPIQEDGIPLIRTPNIGKGRLILDGVYRISEATFHKWTRRAVPVENDLIMAREAPVGNVAVVPQGHKVCLGQRTVLIRPHSKDTNSTYLSYLLNSDAVNGYVNAIANGATVGHLNVTDIRKLKIPELPKPEQQKRVAAVLTAYDDLIENNNRRIALLENMAEEIYREWFVRLRFPGHESVPKHKGVPEGWALETLGNLCLKITDGAHLSPPFFMDGKPMASVKDMRPNGFSYESMKTISEKDFEALERAGCKPKRNDLLIAKDGSYLKHVFVCRSDIDVVVLSSIAILRPNTKKITPLFFALLLRQPSIRSMMAGYVSGSALPRIILKDFKKMKLLIPEFRLICKFEAIAESFFDQIDVLEMQNTLLAQCRDLLLGRLISGKLSVENLDIQFPPSIQAALYKP